MMKSLKTLPKENISTKFMQFARLKTSINSLALPSYKTLLLCLVMSLICIIKLEGQLWIEVNEDLGRVTDIVEKGGILYTISNTGTFGYSQDMGENWVVSDIYDFVSLPNGILNCLGFFDVYEGLIAVRDLGVGNQFLKTSNSGSIWQANSFELEDSCGSGFIPIDIVVIGDSTAILLGYQTNHYRITYDRGASWNCSQDFKTPELIQVLTVRSEDEWLINDREGIYLSTDAGLNWEKLTNVNFIHYQVLEDSVIIAITSPFNENDNIPKLYLTSDDFKSTAVVPLNDFVGEYTDHFVALSPSEFFLQVSGTKMYYTSDGGQNFKFIQELSNQPLRTVKINDDYFLAGRGLWKLDRDLSAIADVSIKDNYSIFPNPVEDQLTIINKHYDSYQILNLNGQVVAADTNFNNVILTDKLTSGTYFLRLKSGSHFTTSKIIKL
jgi:photosystem II stability/assembly factor-like uncharacterized protein